MQSFVRQVNNPNRSTKVHPTDKKEIKAKNNGNLCISWNRNSSVFPTGRKGSSTKNHEKVFFL
jgi:hypothetical protein